MNWIYKLSRTDEGVTIGRRKISQLLLADDIVLLVFSESSLQNALKAFTAECDITAMKISISKSEVLHLSRNPVQTSFQVGAVYLPQVEKFKSHS